MLKALIHLMSIIFIANSIKYDLRCFEGIDKKHIK